MTKAREPAKTSRKPAKRSPRKAAPRAKASTAKSKAPAKRRRSTTSSKASRRLPTVKAAVLRDLDELAKRDPAVRESARAATAIALAKALDNPKASPTSKSMCARALNDTLDRLLELVPPIEKKDGLDELTAKRAGRLAKAG